MKIFKIIPIMMVIITFNSYAISFKKFTQIQQEESYPMTVAVIGSDEYSIEWLSKNADSFIEHKVPVFTISMSIAQQKALFEKYNKELVIGALSKEREPTLERMGIVYYPALYKEGILFQKK